MQQTSFSSCLFNFIFEIGLTLPEEYVSESRNEILAEERKGERERNLLFIYSSAFLHSY